MMGKKIKVFLKYFLFLGGGIFLVWWQFDAMTPVQFEHFKSALASADYKVMIPVILMSLASHASRSLRWRILIAPMGYRPTLFNTFSVTMVGYLANSFVPRLGEILKCTLLGKYEKIPVQKLIGTIVTERLFDFLCYLIFIVITIIIQFELLGDFITTKFLSWSDHSIGLPLWMKTSITLAGIALLFYLLRFVLIKYAPTKIIQRVKHFIHGLKEGIYSIKKLEKRGWFLFHTLFIWTMYLLQVYIGFSAIEAVSHLGLSEACSVLTLASLAMILTPGGIGTFPTAVFLVLSLYQIDQPTGEAFGWLMWGATTFIVLFFGLLSLALLFFINQKKLPSASLPNEVNSFTEKISEK